MKIATFTYSSSVHEKKPHVGVTVGRKVGDTVGETVGVNVGVTLGLDVGSFVSKQKNFML